MALALLRILRGSVKGADEQPATSATTASRPAAVMANDFRPNTRILQTSHLAKAVIHLGLPVQGIAADGG